MASTAAAGVFNAFAFAGAGFLFKFLDKKGYEDEMKRHNLAMEKLKAAQDKWYENEVAKKNEMQLLLQQLSDANADINETNKAHFRLLRTFRRNGRIPARCSWTGRVGRRMGSI